MEQEIRPLSELSEAHLRKVYFLCIPPIKNILYVVREAIIDKLPPVKQ